MRYRPERIIAIVIPLILLLAIITTSCNDNNITPITYHHIDPDGPLDTTGVDHFKTDDGLIIYFHERGTGDVITERHTIEARYSGRTTDDEIFDSSRHNDQDSPRTLHLQNMITGFWMGLAGVNVDGVRKHAAREGSIRTLVIPPELGYDPGHRLGDETLIFDVHVIRITTPE